MPSLPPSVLVVDDEPFNREILRIPLVAKGYRVAEAEDGPQALAILECETFNLLVLDLQMPLMNGREVLKRVRQMPAHDKMYIAILTANPMMATHDVHAQADFVLYKPIGLREFLQLIDRLHGLPALPY